MTEQQNSCGILTNPPRSMRQGVLASAPPSMVNLAQEYSTSSFSYQVEWRSICQTDEQWNTLELHLPSSCYSYLWPQRPSWTIQPHSEALICWGAFGLPPLHQLGFSHLQSKTCALNVSVWSSKAQLLLWRRTFSVSKFASHLSQVTLPLRSS